MHIPIPILTQYEITDQGHGEKSVLDISGQKRLQIMFYSSDPDLHLTNSAIKALDKARKVRKPPSSTSNSSFRGSIQTLFLVARYPLSER
jgi:hypothetical protein